MNLMGVEETAFREFNSNNMRDFNEYVQNKPLAKDNVYSIASVLMQRSQSPILKATGLKLGEITSKPYYDNAHDGLFSPQECSLEAWGKNRHLLTFEADVLNMIGVGNIPPAELKKFTTEFLINRELS